jgi:peptidoglycan L-alanyl-D-glutamate endopeptidase CwlK
MGFTIGKSSSAQLDTVEENMSKVVRRAIDYTPIDFIVLEGLRTLKRQYELYAKGRTVDELRKAGVPSTVLAQPGQKKVTWTLHSKHFAPVGKVKGRAVDLGVYPYDPNAPISEYIKIKDAMFRASKELGIPIRWGGDWDQDGKTEHGENDFGHFELV